jgi:hypothetical protein
VAAEKFFTFLKQMVKVFFTKLKNEFEKIVFDQQPAISCVGKIGTVDPAQPKERSAFL